jgi:hypothetical protein
VIFVGRPFQAAKGLRRTEFNFAGQSVNQAAESFSGKIEFCTSEPKMLAQRSHPTKKNN